MPLAKSDYLLFLKHPAWLWLKKFEPEKLPPVDPGLQAMFDAGHKFEEYAERHFPEGVKLGFAEFTEYLSLASRTEQAIHDGAKVLFQAKFEAGELACITDVIEMVDDKVLDLYEIKSSTAAKSEHITDLAFQVHVIEASGYTVRNIFVMYVNNQYVRSGEVDHMELVAKTEVTDKIRAMQEATTSNIQEALAMLHSGVRPDYSPSLASKHGCSEWLGVYRHLQSPEPYSIYDLCGLNAGILEDLEALGVHRIVDIPEDFKLNSRQLRQLTATKNGMRTIEHEHIRRFLSTLEYPLYFLDYETLSGTVPAFDGIRPYQQVPFQYSVHILDSPDAELRQEMYLHRTNDNPCRPLAEALRSHIGDEGTVIAWNAGFEKSCNSFLGEQLPEYAEFMEDINNRMVDLMVPFSKGWHVDKDFGGSASIKKVLPVLVPELSYKELEIGDGGSAQRLWMQCVLEGDESIDLDELCDNLTVYCGLDTLAMVKIYEELLELECIE